MFLYHTWISDVAVNVTKFLFYMFVGDAVLSYKEYDAILAKLSIKVRCLIDRGFCPCQTVAT